jgi:hypothetical protein
MRGRRIVQANPVGTGVVRWLRSSVIEHMHQELDRERPRPPRAPRALRDQAVSA